MSAQEKAQRWVSYKQKILREYRRIVKGKFSSEKALIKRYTQPLDFIKYKLKRSKNLKV